jgi:hypothetical protein
MGMATFNPPTSMSSPRRRAHRCRCAAAILAWPSNGLRLRRKAAVEAATPLTCRERPGPARIAAPVLRPASRQSLAGCRVRISPLGLTFGLPRQPSSTDRARHLATKTLSNHQYGSSGAPDPPAIRSPRLPGLAPSPHVRPTHDYRGYAAWLSPACRAQLRSPGCVLKDGRREDSVMRGERGRRKRRGKTIASHDAAAFPRKP